MIDLADDAQVLFLTGATGFLGHYLLAGLLRRPHTSIRLLLRPPLDAGIERLSGLLDGLGVCLNSFVTQGRVHFVEGELPGRLDAGELRGVDTLIHAAASTSFDTDAFGEPRRTNVDGTRFLLDAASEAGVGHLVHVSTAYVCGETTGVIAERLMETPPEFRNDYERSKWDAEQCVWGWSNPSRVATICRPSILFGDRNTGRATTMTGLYIMARATEILSRAVADDPDADRHKVPLRIIGRAAATANVVPVCYAAKRIATIICDSRAAGHVHHIINPEPPTLAEIKRWLEAHFDLDGGSFVDPGRPLEEPNHFEDLFYSISDPILDYFRNDIVFESRDDARRGPSERLIDREHFLRCLQYAQATNWGRRSAQPVRANGQAASIDPRWYFEEFLPDAVPRSTISRIGALTAVTRFIISGRRAGEWVCRFDRGRLVDVRGGANGQTEDFSYAVPYDQFVSVVRGRVPLQDVFFKGGAEMFGDIERALKMVPVMQEFLVEFSLENA